MHSNLVEKELKYVIDSRGYSRLLRALPQSRRKVIKQRNYYFDTPKLALRKKRIGLRIRLSAGNQAEITVKHPANESDNEIKSFKARQEISTIIPPALGRKVIQGKVSVAELGYPPLEFVRDSLSAKVVSNLTLLGCLQNRRTLIPLKKDLLIELDACKLNGDKFYELEVETHTPKKVDEMIQEMLTELKISYELGGPSKLSRFIDYWKKNQRA